jgi:hypothetical protein
MIALRSRARAVAHPLLVAVLGAAAGMLLVIAPAPARLTPAAHATTGGIGYAGPSTSGDGPAATGEKPESKLWFNDGLWWGSLFDTVSQTHHIFRLDRATHTWVDTGTLIDNRPGTRADTLWDGTRLYISSHVRASSSAGATSGNPARLYRFSYHPATKTYTRDAGFPTQINNVSSETLTIDKDAAGGLWATWAQDSKIYANATTGASGAWGTPFVLPSAGATTLSSDDISAVISFRGRIAVVWSNQPESAVYFAMHTAGSPATTWNVRQVAVQGTNVADDHISLRSLETDPSGRIYAVIKTGLDEGGNPSSSPQILLLARNPATGAWSSYPVARVSDCHTRPILMLDSEHQRLYVFLTAPDTGCPFSGTAGTIFMKSSPMGAISFSTGRGTPVIKDAQSPNLNNVTSAKQSVTSATGLVVLASNDATKRYWHADLSLVAP